MTKKIALLLSIFPGSLFVLAFASYVICSIAESGLPGGTANIGLGILALAALLNLPTMVAWGAWFVSKSGSKPKAMAVGLQSSSKQAGSDQTTAAVDSKSE